MLEIPESRVISLQASALLTGKKIVKVLNATSHHKFTWYNGNPKKYSKILQNKVIQSVSGHGAFLDIHCSSDTTITISDGTNMRYGFPMEKHPQKYQLMVIFEDETFLVFTVAMYGAIYAYKGKLNNSYYQGSLNSISPLTDDFDKIHFENLIKKIKKDISVKALLATEQRIPGLGNGVLQDILFNAGINPRRKISTLSEFEKNELFDSLKTTLKTMTDKGGRDTEKDFYGKYGGYKTILSRKTYKDPCPNCGTSIIKEAYLGGSVYYCPVCQKLKP